MKLDKRTKFYKTFKGYSTNDWIGAIFAGLLAGFILAVTLYNATHPSPKPPQTMNVVKVQEVKAIEKKYCYDVISCIRDVGEERGFSNEDIMRAIRIAKCESTLISDRIAHEPNGTFSVGVFQINDVHNKRISRADRLDFVKNIKFAWTLRGEQKGWQAWTCSRLVK